MDRETFERMVERAIKSLPEAFLTKLDNVEVVIEAWPSQRELIDARVPKGGLLFGLYQGTPKTKRTHATVFPDKITIFAGPILAVSRDERDAEDKVRSVVRHEIAHHFGLDEASVRKTGH